MGELVALEDAASHSTGGGKGDLLIDEPRFGASNVRSARHSTRSKCETRQAEICRYPSLLVRQIFLARSPPSPRGSGRGRNLDAENLVVWNVLWLRRWHLSTSRWTSS